MIFADAYLRRRYHGQSIEELQEEILRLQAEVNRRENAIRKKLADKIKALEDKDS